MKQATYLDVTYSSAWREIGADIRLTSSDDTGRVYAVTLSNRFTGESCQFEMHTGSHFAGKIERAYTYHPSCCQAAGLLATYAMYCFKDGDVTHGLQPYSTAESTHVGDEAWCESTDHDPELAESADSWRYWVTMAHNAARVMSYDTLSLAYEL
jgi:hypothetical protein